MSSFAPALKHLVSGESNADKSMGALAITTMCEEGNEPPDDIVDEIHTGLFTILDQNDDIDLQVGMSTPHLSCTCGYLLVLLLNHAWLHLS
jgi:hypothetical protein